MVIYSIRSGISKTDLADNTFGYKKRDYPTRWDNLFSIW